jgi:hypothetical protein
MVLAMISQMISFRNFLFWKWLHLSITVRGHFISAPSPNSTLTDTTSHLPFMVLFLQSFHPFPLPRTGHESGQFSLAVMVGWSTLLPNLIQVIPLWIYVVVVVCEIVYLSEIQLPWPLLIDSLASVAASAFGYQVTRFEFTTTVPSNISWLSSGPSVR